MTLALRGLKARKQLAGRFELMRLAGRLLQVGPWKGKVPQTLNPRLLDPKPSTP